jgi:prepilin-type N-terminal cleavage/methylation domain-containing protein
MKQRTKKQLGFTLVEIMIVLAIIGTAIGGILYYQSRAENTQAATKTSSDVALMASKIKTYFRASNSYTNVTASRINGMALVTAPMKFDGTNMVDPWGNTMSVAGGTLSFAISMGGATAPIDKEVCTSLASALADKATAIRVGTAAAVSTSGSTAGTISGGNLYKGAGVTADSAALATGCNESSTVIAMQFN